MVLKDLFYVFISFLSLTLKLLISRIIYQVEFDEENIKSGEKWRHTSSLCSLASKCQRQNISWKSVSLY